MGMKGTSLLCSRIQFRSNITAHAPLGVKPVIGILRVSVGEKKEELVNCWRLVAVPAITARYHTLYGNGLDQSLL